MKIHFIIPNPAKTGGIAVVLEYTRKLQLAGHDVRIYSPVFPYRVYSWKPHFPRRVFAYFRDLIFTFRSLQRGFDWFPGGPRLHVVPFIHSVFLRPADAVIATAWPTAYDVAALPLHKGAKFYFIQHYENWNGALDRLDASFRLPLSLLTIAPWLTDLMRERFNRQVEAELHNGIDLTVFRPAPSRAASPLSILMMHHVLDIKGVPDGLEVLRRIHARYPEVRIRLFGMYPYPEREDYMEHIQDPSRADLVALYQQSHIFLTPSLSEGWHLPPMEAMACGCAVVATRVGCIPVLERDGNLLGAEPGDRDALFRSLTALIEDPVLLSETARKGLATMQEYGWEKMAVAFERALSTAIARSGSAA